MTLADRLKAGETLFTAWSGIPDALTVEVLAAQDFDVVTLDMQHGGHNEDSVLRSIVPVKRANKPAIVRVPVGRFDMASRALDFGAEAVIAPMINSLDDARRFAASMKYPPLGERSWGPTYAGPRGGLTTQQDWLRTANARTYAIAMIETRAAVDALDGILATPGIDGIFLGPSDFSIAWTHGQTIDTTLEDMMEAIADIAKRAEAAGKFCGIYIIDPAVSGRMVAMGYRLLALGSEHKLISLGAETLLKSVRDAIG